jgi:hypothetical protein
MVDDDPVPLAGHDGACPGALPNLVIIGAMKCGTTSLHHYLDLHPEISMSRPKELNFFVGRDDAGAEDRLDWSRGNWHRGARWYAGHFDPAATVRGEASPGYTSPSHPLVAGRMAALVPDARLVYAVRDPVARAVSQYLHHRREGTETRDLEDALLDAGSQYIARGRYFERLAPFLDTGVFADSVTVVAQEQLHDDLRTTMRDLFARLHVDGDFWCPAMNERRSASSECAPALGSRVRHRLAEAFRDDADRLRDFTGREFPAWSV